MSTSSVQTPNRTAYGSETHQVATRGQDYPLSARERTTLELNILIDTNNVLLTRQRNVNQVQKETNDLLKNTRNIIQKQNEVNQEALRAAEAQRHEIRTLTRGLSGGAGGIGAALLFGLSAPRVALAFIIGVIAGAIIGKVTDKKHEEKQENNNASN
ncbi:MAG: hypothetical protein HW387_1731 [Parachlamydiales bacterium]|nr:hypothetical protein [Parachlamydiales bacterium]